MRLFVSRTRSEIQTLYVGMQNVKGQFMQCALGILPTPVASRAEIGG